MNATAVTQKESTPDVMDISVLSKETLYSAWYLLERIYPPILCMFGLCGNVLSVLTLRKRTLTSTRFLLTSLAVTDSLVLAFCVLKKWVMLMTDYNIREISDATCKIDVFLTYFLLQLSPWLLVLITLERVYCVLRPESVRGKITVMRSCICICLLIFILFGLNSQLLCTFTLHNNHGPFPKGCYPKNEYETFMFKIWTWVDLVMAFGLPFLFLLVGNVIILFRLRSSEQFRTSSGCSASSGTSRRVRRNRVSQWTAITLTLNTAFIVLVMPSVVFGIGQVYWFPPIPPSTETFVRMHFVSTIVFMLMYSNSAVNFVFYMVMGSAFRTDLNKMLSGWRQCGVIKKAYHTASFELSSIISHSNSSGTHVHLKTLGSCRSDSCKC